MRRGADEFRSALDAPSAGGNLIDIIVNIPFADVGVNTSMVLSAGCDHHIDTCEDKFDNRPQYSGFPYVPIRSIFRDGADK